MGNITSGKAYTISHQTDNGEVVYLTAGFGDLTLGKLIPPHNPYETDPTQSWTVVGDLEMAQLESGFIANANYAINFYLTSDSGNKIFSATSDPLNATYWRITDADSSGSVYLELMKHDGTAIGFMEYTNDEIKLTPNKQKWKLNAIQKRG